MATYRFRGRQPLRPLDCGRLKPISYEKLDTESQERLYATIFGRNSATVGFERASRDWVTERQVPKPWLCIMRKYRKR